MASAKKTTRRAMARRFVRFRSLVRFLATATLCLCACGSRACEEAYSKQATTQPGLCVELYASKDAGHGIQQPRGLISSPETGGDLIVADRGEDVGKGFAPALRAKNGRIVALRDADGSGKIDSDDEWVVLAEKEGINHGVAVHGGYLFASTSDEVWRWPYSPGDWKDLGPGELVIRNMDQYTGDTEGGLSSPTGHTTRTMVFDNQGRIYISVGSLGNVDEDSFRSRIRRFENVSQPEFSGNEPLDFVEGEVFADGLRNEVGLGWSDATRKVLYGVENGMDNLYRADLGGDIHQDNPAEELNAFPIDQPGRHYGYPWCFTEFKLDHPLAGGRGAQWALEDQDVADDAYCKDPTSNVPPLHSMQGHSAPLGIAFYGADWGVVSECCTLRNATACDEIRRAGGLPCEYANDAFVSFHGSWNRDEPTGHKVVRLRVIREGSDGISVEGEEDFVWAADGPQWSTGLRPVDIAFGPGGKMFISSRTTGEILVVSSTGAE